MKKKLLVIIPFIPYPLNTGGNQGSFHMLNYVKDFFDTHIWFHINDEKKSKALIEEFSQALNYKVHIHYTANRIGRNYITARAIKRKFDSYFLNKDVQYLHNTKLWGEGNNGYADIDALEDINKIIVQNDIDLVQMEYTGTIDFVYAIPDNVKKIFVHHELAFVRHETQMKQLEKQYVYDRYYFRKRFSEEITALDQYDHIITMSEIDKEKLVSAGVKTPISSSPSFIPQPEYPSFTPSHKRLTYVASGGHYPNVEGLEWFIQNIHPLLNKAKPDYTLEVCGPKWNTQNIKSPIPPNIVFKGFVKDLRDVVPGSVMIVPILSGSGMRMKIIESVNNTVPFVSTVVGAEGLDFTDQKNCYITDNVEEYTDDIIRLLDSEQLQLDFVMKARDVYEEKYSPRVQANKRLQILKKIVNQEYVCHQ